MSSCLNKHKFFFRIFKMNFQSFEIFSLFIFCTLWSAKANYYRGYQQPSVYNLPATTSLPYYNRYSRTRSATVPVRNTPRQAQMRSYRVESDIKFRYSRTKVISQFLNTDQTDRDQQAYFNVLLPEKAFISEFVMETGGKFYTANIERQDDARDSYGIAKIIPVKDGFLEMSKRDSNMFSVNVTLPARETVTFHVTYEELLERKNGMYTYFVNIDPALVVSVPTYEISVNIEDVYDLINLEATGINLTSVADSQPHVTKPTPNKATIQWHPSSNVKEMLKASKNATDGRFKVHFDCDRGSNGEQLLISNGYFAHFIAPENLPEMTKHVIFVLDLSAGMSSEKLRQLKQAQSKILDELRPQDYFNIVLLNDRVHVWNSFLRPLWQVGSPLPASPEFIDEAKIFIESLVSEPRIYAHFWGGLLQALYLTSPNQTQTNRARANSHSPSYNNVNVQQLPANTQSLIMFITAGNPNLDNNARGIILKNIREHNGDKKVPIHTLAFGNNAKFIFLHKLATQNNGKARKIYEGSDSDVVSQIHGFFREEMSKLLLTYIQTKYRSQDFEFSEVTMNTNFPTLVKGSEIVVAGRLTPRSHEACGHSGYFQALIQGTSTTGLVARDISYEDIFNVGPACRGPSESWDPRRATVDDKFLESLWAHLKIHQGIESYRVGGGRSLTQFRNSALDQAMQVALQYGFVTDITSLVVARPKIQSQSGTFRGKRSASQQYQDPDLEPVPVDYIESDENGENNVSGTGTLSSNATTTPRSIMIDFDSIQQQPSTESFTPPTTTTTTPPPPSTTSTVAPPASDEISPANAHYSIVELKDGFGRALTFPNIPSNVHLWSSLSLEDSAPIYQISWLGQSVQTVRLFSKVYNVARNENAVKRDDSNYYCTNSQNGGEGVCRHLKDCVTPEIANSLKTFKEYFCPITSHTHNVNNFVGVCCPFSNRVTPVQRQLATN